MREIIYLQIGEFSNYTGTHFWNTQESYISSPHDPDHVDAEVSFCEVQTGKNGSTLCPRLLVVDKKSNFGSLATSNALGEIEDPSDDLGLSTWNGGVVEVKQTPVQTSPYHRHLEASDGTEDFQDPSNDVRFWSDFNRLYLLPRSLQKLPDALKWDTSIPDWEASEETFRTHDHDTDFMDEAFRRFVEDCDALQGIQIMNDSDIYGGFTKAFFAAFRDEFIKLPSLTVPLKLGGAFRDGRPTGGMNIARLISEAMYIRALNEYSTVNINILDVNRWPERLWNEPLNLSPTRTYHQSAILSAHIESTTLPLRLKQPGMVHDIPSLAQSLKWRTPCSFFQLSGVFPIVLPTDLSKLSFTNFSSTAAQNDTDVDSVVEVVRGLTPTQTESLQKTSGGTYTRRISAPAYPIPDSFPRIYIGPTDSKDPSPRPQDRLREASLVSRLSASNSTAAMLREYASTLDDLVARRPSAIVNSGVPLDDLKDLLQDLWAIHDNADAVHDEGM